MKEMYPVRHAVAVGNHFVRRVLLCVGEGSWKAWRPSSRLSKSSSSLTEPFVVLQSRSPSCRDLVSKEPKSLSLDSPAVGVNIVEPV